jgi:hypothetical protein
MDDEVGAGDDQGSGWLEVKKVFSFSFYYFFSFLGDSSSKYPIRQLKYFTFGTGNRTFSLKYNFFGQFRLYRFICLQCTLLAYQKFL